MPPTLQVICANWSGPLFAAVMLGFTLIVARRQWRGQRLGGALAVLALGLALIAGTRSAIGFLVHVVLVALYDSNDFVINAPLGWLATLSWACWAGALGLASRDAYRELRAGERRPSRSGTLRRAAGNRGCHDDTTTDRRVDVRAVLAGSRGRVLACEPFPIQVPAHASAGRGAPRDPTR